MTPKSNSSTNADDIIDIALHHEIKWRAYELYEQRHDAADGPNLTDELPRVAYAVAQIQKNSDGQPADNRAVRAARVYLCALSSFISAR